MADFVSRRFGNVFQVAEADIAALMKAWEDDANWMKRRPGYISTQLHQAIGGSTVFLNYAVWGVPPVELHELRCG